MINGVPAFVAVGPDAPPAEPLPLDPLRRVRGLGGAAREEVDELGEGRRDPVNRLVHVAALGDGALRVRDVWQADAHVLRGPRHPRPQGQGAGDEGTDDHARQQTIGSNDHVRTPSAGRWTTRCIQVICADIGVR